MNSEPLARAACLLDDAVGVVVGALSDAPPRGHYEADLEVNLMIGLILRHAEAIGALAREGCVLFPSAMAIARAAYETALRALWIIDPDNPFEREARWLVHIETSERVHERLSEALSRDDASSEADDHTWIAQTIREFRLRVLHLLPENVLRLDKMPNLESIVNELGHRDRYLPYRIASQYVHATHFATGLYRKNLGIAIETGEFITPAMWRVPITLIWFALEAPTKRLLECLAGDLDSFEGALPREALQGVLEELEQDPRG